MLTRPICRFLLGVVSCAILVPAVEIPLITLREAGGRTPPAYGPAREGQEVMVRGVASAAAVPVLDYSLLAIQDDSGFGLFLEESHGNLQRFRPGDRIAAKGTVSKRGGMNVLIAREVELLNRGPLPQARLLSVEEIQGFRYLGTRVRTEATVVSSGENSGGSYLAIGGSQPPLRVFLPRNLQGSRGLNWLNPGDRIRVVGLASQYCPIPPHDRFFQIIISSPAAVTIVQNSSSFPAEFVFVVALAVMLGTAAWMWREARMKRQRALMRTFNSLGEEILAAGSVPEILRRLEGTLPRAAKLSSIRLYLYNRAAQQLERVPGERFPEPLAVDLKAPAMSAASGAAVCFKNRALLAIPDSLRSPLFQQGVDSDLPRSIMYVPLFAQNELLGVLELDHKHESRSYKLDEQAAAQHLGNQIGAAVKLIEQQSIREQLFRSEKLAAAGQLISGIANELRDPLDAIASLSSDLLRRRPDGLSERDLRAMANEANRAAAIVSRLVSFSRPETRDVAPVEIHGLLRGLIRFRQPECEARGIQLRTVLAPEQVNVSGVQGQLEHVFLNLLVHAEQSQALSHEKVITVSTSLLARRVLMAIGYNTAPADNAAGDVFEDVRAAEAGALGLGVCRGIIQSHGGEIRLLRTTSSHARFEVELPVVAPAAAPEKPAASVAKRSGRFLTALIVDPDTGIQRHLVGLLSAYGFRVVPVPSAEEAIDLIERLHFDLTLCSVRLPGLNWIEFLEKVRKHLGAFILMTEGYDEGISRLLDSSDGLILPKPFDEAALASVLASVEDSLGEAAAR